MTAIDKLQAPPLRRDRILVFLRTCLYYFVSAVIAPAFLLFLPLKFAPHAIWWPVVLVWLRCQRGLLKAICGLSHEIRGWENLPDGACLIASQHESTWENLHFQDFFSNPAIFVKQEIFTYPLAGAIARMNGHIVADRSGDLSALWVALNQSAETIASGRNVLIFPTGARASTGVLPLKRGVALLYRKLGVACIPVRHNSGEYWRTGTWLKYPGVISVEILPPIPPYLTETEFFGKLSSALNAPTPIRPNTPSNSNMIG